MTFVYISQRLIHHEPKSFIPTEYKSKEQTKLQGDIGSPDNGNLPIILTWRFGVNERGTQVFSFIVSHYFTFNFQKGEQPLNEIMGVIESSHNLFIRHLFKIAWNETIDERSIATFDELIVKSKANEIVECAKKLLLL